MSRHNQISVLLFLLYVVIYLPGLGLVNLFDWDEVNFAEAAREMLVSGNWLDVTINYEPFWEKPPLFIWMQALSMKIFGVTAFAARFPNFIAGLITSALLYRIAYRRYTIEAALGTVLLYTASITPQLYFRSGIIDPWFNLFIFLSILQLIRAVENEGSKTYLYCGLFLGLAVLTKGPVAILIVGMTGLIYQLGSRKSFYSLKDLLILSAGLLLIIGSWLGMMTLRSGSWFISEFVRYQVDLFLHPVATHGQPFYYHAMVLLLLCFPLTIIALPSLINFKEWKDQPVFERWNQILFWVVLILFSLVTTKIVHYSSLCYIPMSLLAGKWLSESLLKKWQAWMIIGIGALVYGGAACIQYLLSYDWGRIWLQDHIKDDFFSIQLRELNYWPESTVVLAITLLFLLIVFVYTSRRQLHNGLIMLLAIAVCLGLFLRQSMPAVESITQHSWVQHLKTYKGQEMFHFTEGFKSYAHYFYTELPEPDETMDARGIVAKNMQINSFYEISESEKREYEVMLRDFVIRSTEHPFSLTLKQTQKPAESYRHLLKEVFRGNGYVVYERRVD